MKEWDQFQSWKGICQGGVAFNASYYNRKLIGARYYLKGYEAVDGPLNETRDFRSPRDVDGHGTHAAGTMGGRRIANASAIEDDILAAFNDPIADGVHVLSVSLGSLPRRT
ncbi:hypothetical protein CQW23_35502 [Capsicum baccatum]|uniref:Peptidase S8/S53 domain-containing protein n=1 Tax=Capsicum baccatum TaxID=33114 RepID=A0A2G2UVS9_CAPBA|nr:hypothetical protein CQW23_35502 [Capsicum baccatum]